MHLCMCMCALHVFWKQVFFLQIYSHLYIFVYSLRCLSFYISWGRISKQKTHSSCGRIIKQSALNPLSRALFFSVSYFVRPISSFRHEFFSWKWMIKRGWDLAECGWDLAVVGWDLAECGWDLAESGRDLADGLELLAVNAKVARVLGSIPASSEQWNLRGVRWSSVE